MGFYFITTLMQVNLLLTELQGLPVIPEADLSHAEDSGIKQYCLMNIFYCQDDMVKFGNIH